MLKYCLGAPCRAAKKDGKVTFPRAITKEGKYQVRLFENDSFDLLAVCDFTVADN